MQYGHFDDKSREYVITNYETPLPWINYLGSDSFFTLLSNTAGGYAFYKDARLRRITRYRYNNLPLDQDGFHIYIKDKNTIWNPGWQPTKTKLDHYECHHGLGYTTIIGRKNKVEVKQELYVPKDDNILLMRVTVDNKDKVKKELDLFSFIEFCLWDAQDDTTNFQRNYSTGEVEVVGSTIYHKTEYRERRNHYAAFHANKKVTSFDTSRDAFMGVYGSPAAPNAVKNGKCSDSIAHGWQPVGAHHFHLELEAGESYDVIFALAYVEVPEKEKFVKPGIINKEPAKKLLGKYDTNKKFDAGLKKLNSFWTELLEGFEVSTSNDKVNRMVNIW
ncbi:MAG: hypothetical protein II042_00005, partial [Erysipelotrichaceae bacterium]|nr:hypothetical protein [Erysipelotrichaceae bacterium]